MLGVGGEGGRCRSGVGESGAVEVGGVLDSIFWLVGGPDIYLKTSGRTSVHGEWEEKAAAAAGGAGESGAAQVGHFSGRLMR
jgi:hypothetical protein